jgi:hypothetical protein
MKTFVYIGAAMAPMISPKTSIFVAAFLLPLAKPVQEIVASETFCCAYATF